MCVSNLIIIDSDNGLLSGRRQAIIWTNDGQLLIGPLGTNFSEILIQENAFESVVWEMAAILSRPRWVNLLSQEPDSGDPTYINFRDNPMYENKWI